MIEDKTDFDKYLDLTVARQEYIKKEYYTTAIDIDEKDLRQIYSDILKRPWKEFPLNKSLIDEETQVTNNLCRILNVADTTVKELAKLIVSNVLMTCYVPKGYDTKGYDPTTFRSNNAPVRSYSDLVAKREKYAKTEL
jgi:hypothetical protein